MRHQAAMDNNTQRKIGLHSESTLAAAFVHLSGWNEDRHSRRKGDPPLSAARQLIAVIQGDIAYPRAGIRKTPGVHTHQRVAELVAPVSRSRPLLGEAVVPVLAV